MADRDTPERFHMIGAALFDAFDILRVILQGLPIPVTVIDFDPEADRQSEALLSLARAHDLIEDEPMSNTAKRAHENLILDWLIAYEMMALVQIAGPAPWRMDCADLALTRFAIWADTITEGDLGDNES